MSSVGFFSSSAISCCLLRSSRRLWACALRSAALFAARAACAAASASAWALAKALALLRALATLLLWTTFSSDGCWAGAAASTLAALLRPGFLGSGAGSDCVSCGAAGSDGSATPSRSLTSCSSYKPEQQKILTGSWSDARDKRAKYYLALPWLSFSPLSSS